MPSATIPFNYGLFYHAMIGLLGRTPDRMHCYGFDGFYSFLYIPQNDDETKKFRKEVSTLRAWLSNFELAPLDSRCDYGRLVHPTPEDEGKDYLSIVVVHPVTKGT